MDQHSDMRELVILLRVLKVKAKHCVMFHVKERCTCMKRSTHLTQWKKILRDSKVCTQHHAVLTRLYVKIFVRQEKCTLASSCYDGNIERFLCNCKADERVLSTRHNQVLLCD